MTSIRMHGPLVAGTAGALLMAILAGCAATGTPAAGVAHVAGTSPTATIAPATPTPRPSPSTSAGTTALDAARILTVKGRAPHTGYTRDQFGSGWVDVDRNGCDTRNDILAAQLTQTSMKGRCTVMSGTLSDPYTGTAILFERGGASEVDIDHVVALGDAWEKGAQQWEFAQRVAFANDPLNLIATDSGANRQKGDGDTATWLPPNTAYRCAYVARQVAVKRKYGVWVTPAEQEAMVRVLSTCPAEPLPDPGTQPVIAANTGGAPPAAPAPAPDDPRFGTCAQAQAAGYGPYVGGVDPEYSWYRDGDKDGTTCE